MRPAGLNKFRKLWGRIYQNLEPGDYYIKIYDSTSIILLVNFIEDYDIDYYDARKYIVIQNLNSFGGKNIVL